MLDTLATPDISRIAALIGDPVRAAMLTALMSGKALTASELARETGVTLQTVSRHLARLHDAGLIFLRREGRHKYVSLATGEVVQLLENLTGLAAGAGHLRLRTGPKNAALREARACYNHLAGERGTQLYDALVARGFLGGSGETCALTPQGAAFMTDFGIDLNALKASRSPMCRPCLDWSARRSHLAGSLGRALLQQFIDLGWAQRRAGTREIAFTKSGRAQFDALFG